jgi:soluble lytic murein transglycosylase-like protein
MGIPISIKVGNVNISNANAHEPQPTATETEEVLASPAEERQAEDMVNVTFDLPNSTPSPSGPQPEGCSIDSSWPAAIQQWCGFLTAYAPNLAGYSADWGAAQMFQESHGNPNALSSTCASGLIQVMPSDGKGFIKYRADGSSYFVCDLVNGTTENYVKFYNGQFRNRPTIAQLRDPGFNVKYAMSYMTGLLKSHNDIQKSLVYYGGIAYGDTYKNAVTAHYNCYVQKLSTSCK